MSSQLCRATSLNRSSASGEAALQEIRRLAAIHSSGENESRICDHGSDAQGTARLDHAARIRQCGRRRDLGEARRIHNELLRAGLGGDRFLSNLMVEMYGRCGSVGESRTAFDAIVSPNIYSWTLLMAAYAQNGHHREVLEAVRRMDWEGVELDSFAYNTVLNVVSSKDMLSQAKWFHDRILSRLGLEGDVFLATAVVNMYGRCGTVRDAQEVFLQMQHRDVVAWNAMLSAYAHNGHEIEALELFRAMDNEGVKADRVVFVSLLDACARLGSLEHGEAVHQRVTELGFEVEDVLGHSLLNMYGKCGNLEEAKSIFGKIVSRNVVSWNVLLTAYLQNGLIEEALLLFTEMMLDGTRPDDVTFNTLVNSCTGVVSLEQARLLHQRLIESEAPVDAVMRNAIMNLYVKAGSLKDARAEFYRMEYRDVISWTLMLSTYSQSGFLDEAFKLFHHMDLEGVKADTVTYIAVLEACDYSDLLPLARKVHDRAAQTVFHGDVALRTSLVNMYGKCGSVIEAKRVFDGMSTRNEISWNAMLRVLGVNGSGSEAFSVYRMMQLEGVKADSTTFLILLEACRNLCQGRALHSRILEGGFERDKGVTHTLVIMYGKNGSLEEANQVFQQSVLLTNLGNEAASLWNALIVAHLHNGQTKQAGRLLHSMDLHGVKLNKFSYIALVDACTNAKELHFRLLAEGLEADQELGNALITSYGQCGEVEAARAVFAGMDCANIVSWTSVIVAHASNGHACHALDLLHRMHLEGVHPNEVTVLGLIDACLSLAAATSDNERRIIADYVATVANRFEPTLVLDTALLNMHAKCGNLEQAEAIFFELEEDRDSVAWNAMLSAYATNGCCRETIQLVRVMDLEGIKLHRAAFLGLLEAIAGTEDFVLLRKTHARLVEVGLVPSLPLENSLIAAYGRCGSVEDARSVFDGLSSNRDFVSWNALLGAFSHNSQTSSALELLKSMDLEGIKAGKGALLRMIELCSMQGALAQGKLLHARVLFSAFQAEEAIANALITMYAKCGSLDTARKLFDEDMETGSKSSNVVTWTSMVSAYASSGHPAEALELFYAMVLDGVAPTAVTLTSVLSGCSHAGLVEQGVHYFACMVGDHSVAPAADHWNCMVDLLGRAGWLREAEDVIAKMAAGEPLAWKVLLGACRLHGDVERGRNAVFRASDLPEHYDPAPLILLSNMYREN